MDAGRFTGLGFVASYWNADPSVIAPMEVVSSLAVQVAWGMMPSERTEPEDELSAWIRRCGSYGIPVQAWGWCNAWDTASAKQEARYHAERATELGFIETWIANMEEPYDAHGNSASAKYEMPATYMDAFVERADGLGVEYTALAITTTPFFASSQWALAKTGWVTMPQAFTADYANATVTACVGHMEAWGWPNGQIRPLVQVYKAPDGSRPAVGDYLTQSAAEHVGVVPYIVEQAMDAQGRQMLTELKPATFRPPSGTPAPPDGDDMEVIGKQHGIDAAMDRITKLDPGGSNPNRNESDLSTWGAYDKLRRTLKLMVEDYDERAAKTSL